MAAPEVGGQLQQPACRFKSVHTIDRASPTASPTDAAAIPPPPLQALAGPCGAATTATRARRRIPGGRRPGHRKTRPHPVASVGVEREGEGGRGSTRGARGGAAGRAQHRAGCPTEKMENPTPTTETRLASAVTVAKTAPHGSANAVMQCHHVPRSGAGVASPVWPAEGGSGRPSVDILHLCRKTSIVYPGQPRGTSPPGQATPTAALLGRVLRGHRAQSGIGSSLSLLPHPLHVPTRPLRGQGARGFALPRLDARHGPRHGRHAAAPPPTAPPPGAVLRLTTPPASCHAPTADKTTGSRHSKGLATRRRRRRWTPCPTSSATSGPGRGP